MTKPRVLLQGSFVRMGGERGAVWRIRFSEDLKDDWTVIATSACDGPGWWRVGLDRIREVISNH